MLVELLVVLALILANGVFAGAEIAVIAVRRTRITEMIEQRRHGARALLHLRENPERFLATVQIGITVVGASAAAFSGASLADRLTPWLARSPQLAPHAEELALGLVVAAVSYLSIVIGELVPKSLALRSSESYALLLARPLQVLAWIARPLVRVLTASSNVLLRPFGDRTTFTEARHSASEVMQIVEEAMQAGTLPKAAGEIATRALELPELTAADVMVPRKDVVMLPRTVDAAGLLAVLREHQYSRMPVYDGGIDDIVGYVSLKDLFALTLEGKPMVLDDVIRPPHDVPESQRALEVLRQMRANRMALGVVRDGNGDVAGIITIEDVVEELVGDIYSEHITQHQEPIRREGPGVALVAGSVPVRELDRELGVALLAGEGAWMTVGELCIAKAGRVPADGEIVELGGGVRIEIVDASTRRVRSVRVRCQGGGRGVIDVPRAIA